MIYLILGDICGMILMLGFVGFCLFIVGFGLRILEKKK